MRLVDADVIFLLHALNELLDEFIERAFHLHLLELLTHLFIQQIAVQQCLLDRATQIVQRLLAIAELVIHVILESALQQVIGERAEQVFHAHFAGRVGDVFAVANAFHKSGRWSCVVGRWLSGKQQIPRFARNDNSCVDRCIRHD